MTPKAERGDTGKYTLRLKNDSGVVEADINVIVLGERDFKVKLIRGREQIEKKETIKIKLK